MSLEAWIESNIAQIPKWKFPSEVKLYSLTMDSKLIPSTRLPKLSSNNYRWWKEAIEEHLNGRACLYPKGLANLNCWHQSWIWERKVDKTARMTKESQAPPEWWRRCWFIQERQRVLKMKSAIIGTVDDTWYSLLIDIDTAYKKWIAFRRCNGTLREYSTRQKVVT